MRARTTIIVVGLLAGSACTNLGPMPGVTMANAVPDPRTGVEAQFAAVPGFFLSDGAREHPANETGPRPQFAGWFEPGTLIDNAQGIGVGLRYVGGDSDGWAEPMFRYRGWLDEDRQFAAMAVLYGTVASGEERRATYNMTRVGAELGFDLRVTELSRWFELHFTGGASLTSLRAHGTFCVNEDTGYGRDCDIEKDDPADTSVAIQTMMPGGYVGAHIDLFRGVPVVHGVRLGLVLAAGQRPEYRYGESGPDRLWYSLGAAISVGLGESLPD